jgi:hypothetical protein
MVFVLFLFPALVQAQALDDVEVSMRRDGGAGIRLNFLVPVQALRSVPKTSGKTLYISIRLTGADTGSRPLSERTTNFGDLDGRLPLREVTLEQNGTEGDRIIVSFSKTTPYKVYQGRDGRSIFIVIPPQGLNKRHPAPEFKAPPKPEEPGYSGPLTGKMARARRLLIEGKNKQAIVLFRQIVRAPKNKDSQDALELLGLSYERDRQYSRARANYRLYLKRYRAGPGADRVQQRLRNLTRRSSRRRLRSTGSRGGTGKTLVYGSWSQRVFGGISSSSTGTGIDQEALITSLTMTVRKRTRNWDTKGVLTADNNYDFLGSKTRSRVLNAYAESKTKWHNFSVKAGRQGPRGAGVLDRFDGALVGGELFPKWRLNYVVGQPVDYFGGTTQRDFSGVSVDAGTFAGKWSVSLFKIDATADGLVDRRGVGSEIRYFNKSTTAFGMVDYDTYFNELNVAMLQSNWQANNNWNFNLLVDWRKAPYLQISNVLLAPVNSVSYTSVAELAAAEPGIDLVQLAKDRTALSQTVTIGTTMPNLKQLGVKSKFWRKVRFGVDLSYTSLSDLPASYGQPAIPGSETISVTGRAIGTQLFFKNEISVAGFSVISNSEYRAFSAYLTERNRIKKNWRMDIGLKFYQQYNNVGTSLTRLTPSVRAEYRKKKTTFEFELGHEISQSVNPLQNENIDRDYITLGYRYDF